MNGGQTKKIQLILENIFSKPRGKRKRKQDTPAVRTVKNTDEGASDDSDVQLLVSRVKPK